MPEVEMHLLRARLPNALRPEDIALLEILRRALVGTEEIAGAAIAIVVKDEDAGAGGVLRRIDICGGLRLHAEGGDERTGIRDGQLMEGRTPRLAQLVVGGVGADDFHAKLVARLPLVARDAGAEGEFAIEGRHGNVQPHISLSA